MTFDKKEFKKQFPNIAKELKLKDMALKIDEIQDDPGNVESDEDNDDIIENLNNIPMEIIETDEEDIWRGFDPKIEDFLRRASTKDQAIEIIDFSVKRNEITSQKAQELKRLLEEQGIRAFGEFKRPGYYFDVAEKEKLKKQMKKTPLSKG